jgi:hypothetical protein
MEAQSRERLNRLYYESYQGVQHSIARYSPEKDAAFCP